MPRFPPEATKEQKAYLAVGEFMFHFANMEFQLNLSLRSLLKLGLLEASIITSNIDVRTKVYIVKSAMNMKPIAETEWLAEARRDLESVIKMAEQRNILAHNTFFAREDGVDFFRVKAKGKFSLPDEIWTYETFDGFYVEMMRLGDAIRHLTETLVKHPATALATVMAESLSNLYPSHSASIAQLLALGTRSPEKGVGGSEGTAEE